MTSEKLIHCLEKILKLHESLYKIALNKTEIIKSGDVDSLTSVIQNENKHIMALNQLEEERKTFVLKLASGHQFEGEEPTLSDVIPLCDSSNQHALLEIRQKLSHQLHELKRVNQLNQELIFSSLQFVNYSIDLLMPRKESMNYHNSNQKGQAGQTSHVKRSMFDSKA
ncbi:flagellar protein FlgN [Bacillus sp. AK128]